MGPTRKIILTYRNDAHTDGAAAQLCRIYGLYAISRRYGFSYFHNGIARIDNQGIGVLESGVIDTHFKDKFNDFFDIESDVSVSEANGDILDIDKLRPRHLLWLRGVAHLRKRPLLVRVVHPNSVLDRRPDIWRESRLVSPFRTERRDGVLRVAVHVRRGDVHVLDRSRLLPNEYYIKVSLEIAEQLKRLNIPFTIDIHTEIPSHDLTVAPGAPGTYDVTTDVHLSADVDRIDEFNVIPNVNFRINEDAFTSFCAIASSDIVVTSKSCFSYLAGILGGEPVVLYHPFWHSPLDDWIITDSAGHFPVEKFASMIRSYAQRHEIV